MSQACADEGTVVFAKRAKQDIYNANTNNGRLGKNVQFKLCASDHAMNAIDEMSALNRDIKKFFDENGAAYPVWRALEAEAGSYLR